MISVVTNENTDKAESLKKKKGKATTVTEVKEKLQDTILLICQITKPQSEEKLKEVVKICKNTADTYKVLIDYVLNVNHIYTYNTVSHCK